MKSIIRFIVVALLLPTITQAQGLADVEVKRERTFTGEALYGFMNGGADLYFEYGVYSLVTRDVHYKGEEYTIDIYELPSPADAFGIYSLHTFKCLRADSLACFDCLSTYQLQLAVGSKYISVVFPSGSRAARSMADELVRLYVDVEKEQCLDIPVELDLLPPYSGKLKYLRGQLGIPDDQMALFKLLEGIPFTGIWFIANKATKEDKALVTLSKAEDLLKLKGRLAEDDIIQVGEQFIYIKCPKSEANKDIGMFAF